MVAVAVHRGEVASEHAKRASKWVARRSLHVDEVFMTPSTDVRDLGQGGKKSISVASVAVVHETAGGSVGWARQVRSVPKFTRSICTGQTSGLGEVCLGDCERGLYRRFWWGSRGRGGDGGG